MWRIKLFKCVFVLNTDVYNIVVGVISTTLHQQLLTSVICKGPVSQYHHSI